MTAVLDLHDSTLRLWHGDALVESPGYAWFDGKEFRFGVPAMRTQRRTPREVNTRYWSQLSTQPLSPPLGQARHAADLVHAHLKDMHQQAGQPETLLVAAPGTMDRDALSLLLGIVEHLPFTMAGLVHRSAVLASGSGLARGLHVELQLHQTQVTPFATNDQQVTVDPGQVLPGEGLLALQDRLATAIAGSFVSQTRFDPLRSADGEQSLYDALPGALESLQQTGEAQIAIGGYQARITRDDLEGVGAAYRRVLEPLLGDDTPVLLEGPLNLLPGLSLPAGHRDISGAHLAGVISQCESALIQNPEHLVLNRSVPIAQAPAAASPAEERYDRDQATVRVAAVPAPTHVLGDNHAHPIATGKGSLPGTATLVATGTGVTLALGGDTGLQINAQPAREGQALAPGDVLDHASGYRALLIVVED